MLWGKECRVHMRCWRNHRMAWWWYPWWGLCRRHTWNTQKEYLISFVKQQFLVGTVITEETKDNWNFMQIMLILK